MHNLYLVQTVDKYGPNSFLPLAISYQWMFAQTDICVAENFEVVDVLISKKPPAKYVEEMPCKPDVVAMSCYVWNWSYNQQLAKEIKKVYPDCLIIVGGPNVDKRNHLFFSEYPNFDIAVLGEGELAFKEILLRYHSKQTYENIPHVFVKGGKLCDQPQRILDINSIPSPILNGFYDKIIEKVEQEIGPQRWQVTYETLRGCPYRCSFCDIGDTYWTKLTKFDLDRVFAEIDWMSEKQIEYIGVCDSNWGMLERDKEITEYVIQKKLSTGYPMVWDVTWAKSNSKRIYEIAQADKKANTNLFKGITFAMQSLNKPTQEASRRTNLKSDEALAYMKLYDKENIPTYSELIWPMPNETYESLKENIQTLIDMGQKSFLMVHPLVLTYNAEMGTKEYQDTYQIKWNEVPLDTYYLNIEDLENYIIEKTMAVYETNTADRAQSIRGHLFSYLFILMYYYGWGHFVMEYMYNKYRLKHIDFIEIMLNYFIAKNSLIGSEIRETEKTMIDVYHGNRFWGRQVFKDDIFWEYKGASSIVFHNRRKELATEIEKFCRDVFNIKISNVVKFNMDMCFDNTTNYPIRRTYTEDTLTHCIGVNKKTITISHRSNERLDDDEFYHITYHYQRKNRYWKCDII